MGLGVLFVCFIVTNSFWLLFLLHFVSVSMTKSGLYFIINSLPSSVQLFRPFLFQFITFSFLLVFNRLHEVVCYEYLVISSVCCGFCRFMLQCIDEAVRNVSDCFVGRFRFFKCVLLGHICYFQCHDLTFLFDVARFFFSLVRWFWLLVLVCFHWCYH